MMSIPEALNTALQHHQAGRLQEAEALYRKVLRIQPNNPAALHLLGLIAHQTGKHEIAVDYISRAIRLNPKVAEFHSNIGEVYRTQGKLGEAIAHYQKAIALKPDYAEAYGNLGIALRAQGKLDEAIAHCEKAIALKPELVEPYNSLGVMLGEQGKLDEAIAYCERAIALKPDYAEAYCNLGNVLKRQNRLEEAIACFKQALQFKPAFVNALGNLGLALIDQGKIEEAVTHFRQALAIQSNDGIRIRLAMILPMIIVSKEDIAAIRKQFDENITVLLNEKLTLTDPITEIGPTNFYLAYHGQNDRELQVKIAQLYERACPSLLYTAAHCLPENKQFEAPRRKIRVGFISRYFYKHSVGMCFNRLIERLAGSEKLEVILLTAGHMTDDFLRKTAGACSAHVWVPDNLLAGQRMIADLALDVLVYTDLGMDPLTFFLAFARLAPVQCVAVGHPVTTGIPNMDYFISSELYETESSQQHYSEKLVKFKSLSVSIPKTEPLETPKNRGDLGLSVDRRLYVCPAILQKLHPDFDFALAEILRRDPKGEVILFKDHTKVTWHELLMARFTRTMPDVANRMRFLPWAKDDDFTSILMLADVVLDTFHFGLGTTAFKAFAVGTPIVTWPSEFMRGRPVLACYRKMGVMDCVAENPQQYAEVAVRLGTDPAYRKAVKSQILAKNQVLFEDDEVVREFEQFFIRAVSAVSGSASERG